MKKVIIVLTLLLSSFVFERAAAQVSVSINIGTQPAWGPVGYDHVDYYYMPDIDVFYYVPTRQYIYEDRIISTGWIKGKITYTSRNFCNW